MLLILVMDRTVQVAYQIYGLVKYGRRRVDTVHTRAS